MEPRDHWQDAPSEPWRVLAERKIAEWVEQGRFKNLQGEGKPLQLEDNPFLKPELRLSFKILKDAGFAPPWIELGNEIDGDQAACQLHLDQCRRWVRRQAEKLKWTPSCAVEYQTASIRAEVCRFLKEYARQIDEINRKIEKFNLCVPIFRLQRTRLSAEAAVEAARIEFELLLAQTVGDEED